MVWDGHPSVRGHDWPAPGTARGWRGSPEQGKAAGSDWKVLGHDTVAANLRTGNPDIRTSRHGIYVGRDRVVTLLHKAGLGLLY